AEREADGRGPQDGEDRGGGDDAPQPPPAGRVAGKAQKAPPRPAPAEPAAEPGARCRLWHAEQRSDDPAGAAEQRRRHAEPQQHAAAEPVIPRSAMPASPAWLTLERQMRRA